MTFRERAADPGEAPEQSLYERTAVDLEQVSLVLATTPRRRRRARHSTEATTPKRVARQANARSRATAATRRGSRRREQVLAEVQANPGIRVRDIAQRIGLADPSSLYRIVRQLESEGEITKNGPRLAAK
jgi:hypothetical protein